MNIIEITALSNGSHRNLNGNFKTIPDGWAVIPDNMKTENFPFGEVTTEEIDGVMTVTSWVAGTKPELIPLPEEEASSKSIWDIMAEAYSEGVNEA